MAQNDNNNSGARSTRSRQFGRRRATSNPEVPDSGNQGVYRALTDIQQQLKTIKGNRVKPGAKTPLKTKTKAPSKSATAVAKAETKIDGFIHRSIKQLQITLSDPITLVLIVIVFFAAYTHHYNADESLVKRMTSQLKEHEALKPLGDWIDSNVPKFFGILMSVAASMSLKETIRYSTMVVSGVIIMLMPATTITFYAITVASSLLYMRLKVKSDRFIVAGFIVMIYAYYFLDIKKTAADPAKKQEDQPKDGKQ